MTKTKTTKTSTFGRTFKAVGVCVIFPFSVILAGVASADSSVPDYGVIDEVIPGNARVDSKQIQKQVKKEQRELAKQDRQQLKNKAEKGERLAQVALGSDFASEAQMLTFAPAAANDAASDALRWYSLAAKRGYPGSPSLDTVGVKFYPVRVIRNQ